MLNVAEQPESLFVLLVEDSLADRFLIERAFQLVDDHPAELSYVETLQHAIATLEDGTFDVVLLDLHLPDSRGLRTLTTVVEHAPDTPIVVLTGRDDDQMAAAALRCGAQDYLVKGQPNPLSITRAVRYAIERHRAQSEVEQRDEQIRLLSSRIPAVIWTTDNDLRFTSSVGAALRHLGLRPNQVVGQTVGEYLWAANDARDAVLAHHQALEGESQSFETQWHNRRYEVQVDPLVDDMRRIVGTIGVALDVTQRRRDEANMRLARVVQKSLLPHDVPHWPGFDIAGASFSADHTCGDWYDFLPLPDGSIAIVVGDISGHGLPAAILSAATGAWFQCMAKVESGLGKIVEVVHQLLMEHTGDMHFAVALVTRLFPDSRTLEFFGGGDTAVILRSDGSQQTLSSCGPVLGLTDELPFDEHKTIELNSGDQVLLLTDGFKETMNTQSEIFGHDRIVATIRSQPDASSSELLTSLHEATNAFRDGGKVTDDRTGVIISVE